MKPSVTVPPDKEAGPDLEQFIKKLGIDWAPGKRKTPFTIEDLGGKFYRYFKCFVPVSQRLNDLLPELGIERIGQPNTGDADGMYTYNLQAFRWEIHTKYELGLRFSTTVLHELFEIIFWRAYHRIEWWRDWMERENRHDPHPIADQFAWSVILPKQRLREIAPECGYNPVELANRFQVWPALCLLEINKKCLFDHPYFHAMLSYPNDQQVMSFEESSYKRRIQKKAFKPGTGPPGLWPELRQLKMSIPKEDTVVEVTGVVREVIQSQQAFVGATDRILDVKLPTQVFASVRPDIWNRSKVYVQVVPLDCRYTLQLKPSTESTDNPLSADRTFLDHIIRQTDSQHLASVT